MPNRRQWYASVCLTYSVLFARYSETMPGNPEHLIGKTIKGKYQINQLLGQGGFGATYRATRMKDNKDVALKILHPDMPEEQVFRFAKEAFTIMKLHRQFQHPHIVPVEDLDTEDGRYFIVMPLAKTDLRGHVPYGRALPPDQVVSFISQAAEGLQFTHEKEVVHSDVKPQNLLLYSQGDADELTVWVADFGLAIDAHRFHSFPRQKSVVFEGDFSYMAPEKFDGIS